MHAVQLRFQCNRCGACNVNQVNPLAWQKGTVFIECGKCHVRHKMCDHLDIVHEMQITPLTGRLSKYDIEALRLSMPPHMLPQPEAE